MLIDEKPVIVTTEDVGSNFVWAIAAIIITAILAGVLYIGITSLTRNTRHEVDVNIKVPTSNTR